MFARDYIATTIDAYATVGQARSADRGLMLWATNVLEEYFRTVNSDYLIESCRKRFESVRSQLAYELKGNRCSPYIRGNVTTPVEYDNLLKLAIQRRSVRWFVDRPVPRELLDKALAVAAQSPSACNRQPFKYVFFDNVDKAREIASIAMGTAGYAHNIPCVAVIVGQLWAFPAERDRHLIYIDSALSAMAFQFAVETLGLSSCSINWPDITNREHKMAQALELAPDERPIMLLAIGFPDVKGRVAYSGKRSLDELRSYNKL